MSFSVDFKNEIINTELKTAEEKFAFLSAIIRQIGSIHLSKNVVNIQIECEYYPLILKVAEEVKSLFDYPLDIKMYGENNFRGKNYSLELPQSITRQIAEQTGIIKFLNDKAIAFLDEEKSNDWDEKQIKAFLFGIALSSANITVPTQTTKDSSVYEGSYSLEMRFNSENTTTQVLDYFAKFNIFLKKVERSDYFLLYIRDSEMISDFMAFFGGSQAVIEISNIIVARSVRNQTNRVQNCEIANIDKTINAGQKQYLAIKLIDDKIGLANLSEKLREIAVIRLKNPDFSLDQIAQEVGGGISKSGINHRFRKIIEIADTLNKK